MSSQKGNYPAPPKYAHDLFPLGSRDPGQYLYLTLSTRGGVFFVVVGGGRYLNDFSKALASEVRILLAEVGKLRDERRQLQ